MRSNFIEQNMELCDLVKWPTGITEMRPRYHFWPGLWQNVNLIHGLLDTVVISQCFRFCGGKSIDSAEEV